MYMTTQVQFRRGTTSQHGSFTGAVGEVTVDTDLDTLRVHDGAVAGGVRIAKFSDIATQTIDISDSSSNTVSLVPGSTDVTFIGDDITIAAAGNTMTFTLNNTITVDQISSGNSTGITLNDDLLLAGTLRAEDSGAISVDGAMQISGVVTGLTIEATGDTAANDNAAMGYTAAEGLILTGQGSTNDVTIKNDADADVIEIPTGTTNVTIAGTLGTGGAITATGSFIIGSADLNEADLEKLDGITNGTIAANKAVVADANKDVSSFRNLTATGAITSGSFVIGSADINEADLEKIDGITNGAGAANKALVLDGSANIASGLAAVTASGVVTAAGFTIGSAVINETDLEKLDGITNGTVAANKAVVADANLDVGTFRNVNMSGNLDVGGDLQLDGNLTVSGTTNSVNTTTLEVADALLELNKNNSGGADIDGGILIQRGSAGNNAVFYWNEGDDKFKAVLSNSAGTATAVTDSSTATIVANIESATVTASGVVTAAGFTIGSAAIVEAELETIDGVTAGTVAASKAVVVDADKDIASFRNVTATGAITSGSFVIGSADMNEADLEKLDGITNGTIAANKAVVADANKDVTTFRNCTATTFIGALTGNADTATVLATTRAIGGVNFNGSAAINLPGVNTAGNQNTSGTAAIGTAVTVTANNTANETCFITFVDGATGTQGIETDTGLNYNPSTNVLATTAAAAQYSDVAEKYIGDAQYESGTVVIFGGDHEVTTTELTHDPRVAGVVSTAPAYLMNSTLEATYVIDLALTGRVPCKVKGVVAKGDLIVSSQTAGVGMKLQQESYNVGCVIGKALEDKDTADVGVIEVVVGRL